MCHSRASDHNDRCTDVLSAYLQWYSPFPSPSPLPPPPPAVTPHHPHYRPYPPSPAHQNASSSSLPPLPPSPRFPYHVDILLVCLGSFVSLRLYSDEGFDSSKSVYTAKLKELTDLGNPVESRLYETNHRQVSLTKGDTVQRCDWREARDEGGGGGLIC